MLCSYCHQKGIKCVVRPKKSSKCAACIARGHSCDGQGLSVAAAKKIVEKKEHLKREEDKAEVEFIYLQEESSYIYAAISS
ncbi:hypothetical protein BGZ63DRAFT_138807 [Mariannaea sp. PMI_226]|nr:hypothetical protein BGZ63DRAFT_138807 [Mariannaea sp. PMI_226]